MKVKKDNCEKATLRAPTRDVLLRRFHAVESYTHLALREVGHDEAEGTCWDVQISEDCDKDVVVNPVESLTKIDKPNKDSSWFLVIVVKVAVDEM